MTGAGKPLAEIVQKDLAAAARTGTTADEENAHGSVKPLTID